MLTRRDFLATAATVPLASAARAETGSLRKAAAAHGRLYGCATNNFALRESDFKTALLREAGVLVAEYEMKRNAVELAQGHYDFAPADALVRFAEQNGLKFRGHTLVWYHSNPSWLEEAVRGTRDEKLFTGYIGATMRRYRGRVQSWDVVNEAILPKDGRDDGLRKSFWLETFGPSYIDTAFHAAREADPGAELVYNDWGCEAGGAEHDCYRAATLKFLEGAKARGVPIDALGLQGHLQAFGTRIDQAALRRFLDDVKALGYRILVTEHDVDDSGGPSDIAMRDRVVADASARFLDVVLANAATTAVLTWGLSDRFLAGPGLKTWLAGYSPRMLPLDAGLNRTPMWRAMMRAFTVSRATPPRI